MPMLLEGKRLLVTGVLTEGSIAYAVAERAQRAGAEVVLTGFGRGLRITERMARRLPQPPDVRANLVAAGPLSTMAARGIDGFDGLADAWQRQAPLGWDVGDAAPVADACLFLLSDLARAVTGEVLHVDGGYHALGAPLPAGGRE